jgi:23S rRNA (uracil1939-C5)-methyltransferase
MMQPREDDVIPVTHLPRQGESFVLRIDRMDDDGAGRGTLYFELQDLSRRKLRIAVARTVIGDLVRAEVYERRGDGGTGRLREIVEPSADRVESFCPHASSSAFGSTACGGCPMQVVSYERQLGYRRDRVVAALTAHGLQPDVAPALPSPAVRHARNRIELSFARGPVGELALGFHPPGFRHEVVQPVACDVFSPVAGPVAEFVRAWFSERGVAAHRARDESGWLRTLAIREGKRSGEHQIVLTTTGAPSVVTALGERDSTELAAEFGAAIVAAASGLGMNLTSVVHVRHFAQRGTPTRFEDAAVFGDLWWREHMIAPDGRRLEFEVHPRAFFQPNTLQAERLYALAIEALSADGAKLGVVLDLYCGAGTISLAVAGSAERVVGIELVPEAVDAARRAAAHNGVENATFYAGDAALVLGEKLGEIGAIDAIIVDPPRGGLSPEALDHIAATNARRLVYVSCNPESLGRDLAVLTATGWKIGSVQPVDMFPHTPHVETVVRLDRG